MTDDTSELLRMQRKDDNDVKLFIMLTSLPGNSKRSGSIFSSLDLELLKTILLMAHEVYPVKIFPSCFHSILYSIDEGFCYYGMDTAVHTANPFTDSLFSSESNAPPMLRIEFLLDDGEHQHHAPVRAWTQPIPRPRLDSTLIPTVICYTSRMADWGFFEVLILCYRSLDEVVFKFYRFFSNPSNSNPTHPPQNEALSINYTTFSTTDDICDEHRERVLFESNLTTMMEGGRGPLKVAFTRGLHGVITRCVP